MENFEDTHIPPRRSDKSKRLTVLSEAEKAALYELPDFDDFQRTEFFAMTEQEHAIVFRRNGLRAQVYCLLQIGYFKAKRTFFQFTLQDVPREDITFVMERYFQGMALAERPIPSKEYYRQRNEIVELLGYRLWLESDVSTLWDKAVKLARNDVTPTFILTELIVFLNSQKIVRPGYTTLQTIIGDALTSERNHLEQLIDEIVDEAARTELKKLLIREDTLSELAAIKQDSKSFSYPMMVVERQKRATLEPWYQIAKVLLPKLEISQQNKNYYASLANFYSIYDLRRLKPGQTYLYLLCYAWQRYQQLSDNLVSSFCYQLKKREEETKAISEQQFTQAMASKQQEAPQVGRLILLYVDEAIDDTALFGTVRDQAFNIMPKDSLITAGQRLCEKSPSQMDLRWEAVDKVTARCKKNLRPLAMATHFSSTDTQNPWLMALNWMKTVFSRQQTLAQRPVSEIPTDTIPKRLRPHHLLVLDEEGKIASIRGDRYEFWIYRQIRKRFDINELYLNDSVVNRRFSDDLVSMEQKADILKKLDIPWLRQPLDESIDALYTELGQQWKLFDRELRQGKLKHLEYDAIRKHLTWRRKPKVNKDEALKVAFYAKLQAHGIADIFRFVNDQCHFLSALTPLQPRYAKKIADEDSLMAVIIAQALNHGNLSMAETSDMPYHVLEATYQQYLRLSTLKASNDRISNFISEFSIFPYYSFGLESLYGSVDGQKLEMGTPSLKARHSKKYFRRGKGVVAYTLLANHIALQTELIGAHEHESHFLFDICYNNTSNIMPTAITGDMHSINKANFAILHWFGMKLMPRFVSLQDQLKHLYCADDIANYEKFLIPPAGQISRALIESDQAHIDQIVATLGLKEMTQNTLIKKLCALPPQNRTRKAIFEFDKLVRSIYTLKYLRDPQIERDVHRSQNRIESYHQLRSYTSQVSGKKQLIGRTDLEAAITNQCGRLIANVVIAYNSMMLSLLLDKYKAAGNEKVIELLQKISPVAWQHIHFLGHYDFKNNRNPIDFDEILARITFD
ncbi:MAG: Tn3 family transposase [Methylobacter sp.]|uniref:Tn3 family transposase n=1 Tax=Candidatus Methylobacter titanis TaxID=3053457 RepID=A0AA43TLU7_9GAMM|nr:Tn3 family transposase [Candidatus Methylobacter titanis]